LLDCFVYIYNDIFEGKSFDDMTLDELNEREDDIDEEEERIFEAYRFVYISSTQEAYRFVYISRTQEAYRFVYRTQLTGLFTGLSLQVCLQDSAYRFVYISRTQRVRVMVLNSTFNNISVIIRSWRTCQSLTVC